jgi:hypothetical protein
MTGMCWLDCLVRKLCMKSMLLVPLAPSPTNTIAGGASYQGKRRIGVGHLLNEITVGLQPHFVGRTRRRLSSMRRVLTPCAVAMWSPVPSQTDGRGVRRRKHAHLLGRRGRPGAASSLRRPLVPDARTPRSDLARDKAEDAEYSGVPGEPVAERIKCLQPVPPARGLPPVTASG